MKKNNFILLILILTILGACTNKKAPKSLASAWQSKYQLEEDPLVRKVASSSNLPMRFEDIFNSDTLQREAADYERKITGSPIKGFWKHINLESLPIAQARFLKNFGESIGDQANPNSINYEGCTSLPCIFNRIYQRGEFDVAGYVHYIWYLKFGSYLALDNRVPDQLSATPGIYNGKKFSVLDYLYTNDELFGFWRVAHMLEGPYLSLSNLNEIQRIPRDEEFESLKYKTSCGLASPVGPILLTSGCLRIVANDMFNSTFYISLIHEMSHMIDFLQGPQGINGEFFRSTRQDYIDLTGFTKQEFMDSTGSIVTSWAIKPGAKVVRDYGLQSPIENFADSLAFFRQEGDQAKTKLASSHFNWISANYFQGESYDKLGNRSWLIKKYEKVFLKNILNTVSECASTQKNFTSNYFLTSDFANSNVTLSMLKCLSTEAEAISKRLTAHVLIYEPDGHRTIFQPADKNLWDLSVKASLKKHFGVYVQEITNGPEYLKKVKDFAQTLKNPSMANQAILECYSGSTQVDLSACYDAKVIEVSKEAALDLRFPDQQAQEMATLYLGSYPYASVIQDLYLSYRTILNNHESFILEESQSLWQMCLNTPPSDELKPSGSHFSPRKGYLISSIFNCLNTQIPTSLDIIIKTVSVDGEKITHPVEEKIIREFLAPMFNERLYTIHETSMKEESMELKPKFEEFSSGIRSQLISDFNWVKTLGDQDAIMESCKNQSLAQINYLPLFHLKRDAFSTMITDGPCQDIMLDPTFKTFFEKSREEVDTNVFNQIEKILEKNIESRALKCKQTIPWKWEKTKATVRIPRKTCLSLGKRQIEIDTILELQDKPTATRFGITELELRSKISDIYESVKMSVENKYF